MSSIDVRKHNAFEEVDEIVISDDEILRFDSVNSMELFTIESDGESVTLYLESIPNIRKALDLAEKHWVECSEDDF